MILIRDAQDLMIANANSAVSGGTVAGQPPHTKAGGKYSSSPEITIL